MSSKVYPSVFSLEEINSVIDFYESKSISAEDHYSKNKNLEYQIQEDFSYRLLNNKLTEILGEHEFATGAYKECVRPYALHVDAYSAHQSTGTITTFATEKKHNAALLIPLVEGPGYKTVTFKCYSDNNKIQLDWLGNTNTLNFAEYQHCNSAITRLPVDIEYSWHLSDMLVWDRNQLHASADFTRYNVTKKFLILFIA